jgi:outer membrane protein assembly factor BamB
MRALLAPVPVPVLAVSLSVASLAAPYLAAFDFPQWRGPARDGRVPLTARATWPEALTTGWKIKVGIGHSSPIVVGDRVIVFAREGEEEVAQSFELSTGKRVWRQAYPAPYTMNPAATGHGKGPKSTPAVANGRLFTLGISGILSCFDATSGHLVWRKDFAGQFKETSPLFGAAMSPVVDGELLIVHVGGHGDGALTAFEAATGLPRWAWKGDGPAYASPVLGTFGGVRQVVTESQDNVVGLSADKGELLWKIPLSTEYEQNAITPILAGDLVIYGGLDKPMRAARIVKEGSTWTSKQVWENADFATYLSTPVLDGGKLYGLSHRKRGQYFCLDATTGKTLWLSEGRQAENAAILAGGGALFLLNTDGAMIVAARDAAVFKPLRTWKVAESATWAHPALAEGIVLVKDVDTLTLWKLP